MMQKHRQAIIRPSVFSIKSYVFPVYSPPYEVRDFCGGSGSASADNTGI